MGGNMSEEKTFDLKIKNAIVHRIYKEQHKKSTVKYKESTLKFSNDNKEDTANRFVNDFIKSFIKQRSGKSYGVFEEDTNQYPFQTELNNYLSKGDIVKLSKSATGRLSSIMDSASASKGGYVFFLDYELDEKHHFAVIMLNTKNQTGIDDNLELSPLFTLDIENVTMAADIRIDDWENQEHSYISFKKGSTRNEVPMYFYRAIGCTDAPNSVAATNAFVDGIIGYYEYKKLKPEEINTKKNNIFYALKQRKQVSVSEILITLFPDEAERKDVEEYWNKQNIDIPDVFDCDGRSLVKLTHFHINREGFDMKILGGYISKYLIFSDDSEYPTLMVKGLKDDIKKFSGDSN